MLPIYVVKNSYICMYKMSLISSFFFTYILSLPPGSVGGSLEGVRRKERSGKKIKSQAFFSFLGAKIIMIV